MEPTLLCGSRVLSPAGVRAGRRSHPRSELWPCLKHSQGNTWELFISVKTFFRSSPERIDSSSPVLGRSWVRVTSTSQLASRDRSRAWLVLSLELSFTLKGLQVFLVLFLGRKNSKYLSSECTSKEQLSPRFVPGRGNPFIPVPPADPCPGFAGFAPAVEHPQPGRDLLPQPRGGAAETAKTTTNSTHKPHSFLIRSLQSLDSETVKEWRHRPPSFLVRWTCFIY